MNNVKKTAHYDSEPNTVERKICIKQQDWVRALLHFKVYKQIGVKLEQVQLYDNVQNTVKTDLESSLNKFWNQIVRTS